MKFSAEQATTLYNIFGLLGLQTQSDDMPQFAIDSLDDGKMMFCAHVENLSASVDEYVESFIENDFDDESVASSDENFLIVKF